MNKSSPFIKALLVSVVLAALAYVGLEVPKDSVESVVDSGLESMQSNQAQQEDRTYVVQQVIDGDTLKVVTPGTIENVRVLGMNTPETEFSSRGAECFGKEATEYAKTLLEGTIIQLTPDNSQDSRDKYNRMLAYVTLPDGRDFGQVMIADGYAYEYTYQGVAYKNQQLYKATQVQAQEDKVGLWAEGVCKE